MLLWELWSYKDAIGENYLLIFKKRMRRTDHLKFLWPKNDKGEALWFSKWQVGKSEQVGSQENLV